MRFLEVSSGALIAESAIICIDPPGNSPMTDDLHLWRRVMFRIGNECADEFRSPDAFKEFIRER
jgi:hypothetical protein